MIDWLIDWLIIYLINFISLCNCSDQVSDFLRIHKMLLLQYEYLSYFTITQQK